MRRYFSGVFRDGSGNIIQSGTIAVYLTGTTTATSVYTSVTSATAVNSVTSDSTDGSFEFYTDDFDYGSAQGFDISMSKSGFVTKTYSNIDMKPVIQEYTISDDVTLGAEIYLDIPYGVTYAIATGKTLTIYSPNNVKAAPNQQIFSGAGTVAWTEGGPVQAGWFSTPAVAAATLVSYSSLEFAGSDTYSITSSININTSYTTVNLNGAMLTVPTGSDIDVISLNTTDDGVGADPAKLTNIRINGPGYIYNTDGSGTSTKAGIKARDLRYFYIDNLRIEGFEYGIDIAPRDNNYLTRLFIRNNVKGIYVPTFFDTVTPQLFYIQNSTFGLGGAASARAISIESGFNDFFIEDCSISGGDWDYGIYCITGTAAPDISNIGLHINGLSVESIETGHYIIHVEDANTKRLNQITIEKCNLQTGTPTAISLERCSYVTIKGNRFAQTALGGGVPITLDAECTDINIPRGNMFSTASISFACARDEITMGEESRVSNHIPLTGYTGDSFSTSNATIDMSTACSIFPTEAGIVPKAWVINVQARDSGSAGSATAKVELTQAAAVTSQYRALVRVAGVANDVLTGGTVTVPCDANGDIWVNIVASGAGTMDVWLTVVGYYM